MKNPESARRLLIALQYAKMSQRELSEKAQIKESSVSHYVNGSHAPSSINANKMGKVLDVNPLWLMGFEAVPMIIDVKKDSSVEDSSRFKKYMEMFSALNKEGQDKLLSYAEDLSSMDKYKNSTF